MIGYRKVHHRKLRPDTVSLFVIIWKAQVCDNEITRQPEEEETPPYRNKNISSKNAE